MRLLDVGPDDRQRACGHVRVRPPGELEPRAAVLDLDSGVQRSRAHRFYFREGLTITSSHVADQL